MNLTKKIDSIDWSLIAEAQNIIKQANQAESELKFNLQQIQKIFRQTKADWLLKFESLNVMTQTNAKQMEKKLVEKFVEQNE